MLRHKLKSIRFTSTRSYILALAVLVMSTFLFQFLGQSNFQSGNQYSSSSFAHQISDKAAQSNAGANYSSSNLHAASASCGPKRGVCNPLGRDGVKPDSLPAWRWSSIELDADTGGFLGFFQQVPVSIATLFLIIAQFSWNLLLGLAKIALEPTTLLGPAAPAINTVVNQVGERVTIFTIIFWAIVFFKIIKNMAKGRVKEAAVSFVLFSVLFSAVLVLLNGTSAAVKLPDADQVYAKNTMPWFASTVSGASLSMAGDLALATGTFKSNFVDLQDQGSSPTCIEYNNAIYEVYSQGSGNQALPTLSKLWEQTQYKAWTAALFGSKVGEVDLGSRVMCHWAESINRTPAIDQQKLSALAYGEAFGDPEVLAPGEPTFAIFGPLSAEDRRRAMTIWAACDLNGTTWSTAPYFKGVWSDSIANDALSDNPHKCTYPFSTAADGVSRTTGGMRGDDFLIFGDRVEDAFDGLSGADRESLVAFETFASSLSGANTADRLLQSLLALGISVFFLYAIGFLSIGMIAAQLMLIILLMLFPVTIALMAIGSSKAKPMLKLTGTTAVAQAIFALILVTLLILSSIFQELLATLAPAGFLRSLMVGLAPVAAFYVIHKILKTIGMSSILSPTGALSFLASSALVATGDSRLAKHGTAGADGKNSMQKGMGKGAAKGIAAGSMTAATGLAMGKKGKSALGKGKKLFSQEGRDELKQSRIDRKKEKQDKVKKRLSSRMNKGQQSRLDKINNWVDQKQLSNNAFSRTLGNAARGVSLLGLGAAGLSAVAGRYAYDKSSPEVQRSLDKAGSRIKRSLGSDWSDQATPLDADATVVPIGDKDYVDHESALELKQLDDVMLDKAIESDPHSAETLRIDAAGELITNTGIATVGPMAGSIETVSDLANIKYSASLKRGVSYRDLVVSTSGVVVPRAWEFDKSRIKELSIEESKDPMYWLPMEDKIQLEGESPDEYSARLLTLCYERGLVTSSGSFVDAYSLAGYDVNKESDRIEIESWMDGKENKTLENFVITSKNSARERRSVEASKKWIERNNSARAQIVIESQVQAYEDLIQAPSAIPAQLELVLDSKAKVSENLIMQSQLSADLAEVQGSLRRAEIDLSQASGSQRSSIESDMFELRQQFDDLETRRKANGNELDRSFAQVKENLFEYVNTVIRTKADAAVASGSIVDENQLFEALLDGFEDFQNKWDNVDKNISQAWLGNSEAITQLTDDLDKLTENLQTEAEDVIRAATKTIEAAENDATQLAAVRKVRTGSKLPTAKEIAESYGKDAVSPLLFSDSNS